MTPEAYHSSADGGSDRTISFLRMDQIVESVGTITGLRSAYIQPKATPRNWTTERKARKIGDSIPMAGSFCIARQVKGRVLTRNPAIKISVSGTAGRLITSAISDNRRTGPNNTWSFMICGVWLSFTPLDGFLRTARMRQNANLYFFLR